MTRTPLSRSQKVKGQKSRSPGRFTHRGVNASGSIGRGNLLLRCGLHSAGAVGSAARGASASTEGGEGRGQIVAAARLQLVTFVSQAVLAQANSAKSLSDVAV